MGTGVATDRQGPRLPPSRFASYLTRAFDATHRRQLRRGSAAWLCVLLLAAASASAQTPQPQLTTNLSTPWQPVGPGAISSATYGALTGRITAMAADPNDTTGNTLYIGTTGGGVWKSTNAAGALGAVSFAPLTDTLPFFSATAGSGVEPSLSIGALAVEPAPNPVLLAGTGDPNNATDSYYGEGVLRSTDGGLTWSVVQGSHDGANGNHSFIGLATAGLAFSTATPTLVVAAMTSSPQATIVGAATTSSVPGLYYSIDAGATWQMATIEDGTQVVQTPQPLGTGQVGVAATAVVWNPVRKLFFAAVRAHGYYSSADGMTWTRLVAQPGSAMTTTQCPVGANGLGASSCPIYRGALAVQPTTGDTYALTVDANNNDQGLWQDLCNASGGVCTSAVNFANRIDAGAMEAGSGSTVILQGVYNLALAAAPTAGNGTLLFVGTIDVYRCAVSGSSCALRNTTNALDGCNAPAGVFAAQHALLALAQPSLAASGASPLVFVGNDGGLWRSLDGIAETGAVCSASDATHFDNLNTAVARGGSLAMVNGLAQPPSDAATLLAGMGAVGSAGTGGAGVWTASSTPWPQLSAGEGGLPLIDANTPANWYVTIGSGVNLHACTSGANCSVANFAPPATIGSPQVGGDQALNVAPLLLDPADPTTLLTGTCRVWRGPAQSGAAWSSANAISASLDGKGTPCTSTNALIRSLAAGGPSASAPGATTATATVIYAGMAGALDGGGTGLGSIAGHLFVTKNASAATPTWTDTALPNAGAFDVSSIAVDPHDPTGATVYATVQGFGVPLVYRSTNFGASWTNITANVPDTPANAIVVDPNDANTVYLAMDAGVYVTQAVLTCATTNCWSPLGTALPNAPIIALAAGAALPTGDGREGLLRAATYGRGLWQQPLLTAHSNAQPALTIVPTALTFAAQAQGTVSATQTVTVTSSGNAPVVFGTPTITTNFTETDTCAGQTLAVGTSCTFSVAFAPTTTGALSGTLTLYANIAGGQATVALNGTGTPPPAVLLTPGALTFAATLVGQRSAAQTLTVANTGTSAVTLQTPVITGDFAITANTCGSSLAAQTACAISIVFAPTASGTRTGAFSISDDAGTQTAVLTGTGTAPATDTLSATALSFAPQTIGTTSAAQQLTLTNTGGVALTLITDALSPGDFNATNGCGTSLAAHASCALVVTFTPTAVGTRSATLTVTDQFRSQTVQLSGTGVAGSGLTLTPATLSFATTGVGLLSAAQPVTLTNNSGAAFTLSATTISAGFAIAASSCGSSLSDGASCTLQLVFAPTVAGAGSGALTISGTLAGSTKTLTTSLSGVGLDFALVATGPTSATVVSGATAQYTLQLSSIAALATQGSVTMSCAGVPANTTCVVSPPTPLLGQTVPITVTIVTGVATTAAARTLPRSTWLLACAAPALLLVFARRRRHAPLLVLLLAVCVSLSACGTARYIPGNGSSGGGGGSTTASGTYNLTISASDDGLTRSVQLTLIVQ